MTREDDNRRLAEFVGIKYELCDTWGINYEAEYSKRVIIKSGNYEVVFNPFENRDQAALVLGKIEKLDHQERLRFADILHDILNFACWNFSKPELLLAGALSTPEQQMQAAISWLDAREEGVK